MRSTTSRARGRPPLTVRGDRGTSTLLSLAAAITLITVVLGGTLVVVEDAFRDTRRGDAERAVAIQASDRLVAADGPLADRRNVLEADALATIDESTLRDVGASDRFAMAVARDGERLAAVGDPDAGHVVRRIVLIERPEEVERTPRLGGSAGNATTLPVRTDEIELTIAPSPNTTVSAVRANDRVVLADPTGLDGDHTVETAPFETVTLSFEAQGSLSTGDVELAYEATTQDRAMLAVTVSDRTTATPRGESP